MSREFVKAEGQKSMMGLQFVPFNHSLYTERAVTHATAPLVYHVTDGQPSTRCIISR